MENEIVVKYHWEEDEEAVDEDVLEFYRLTSDVHRFPVAVVRKYKGGDEYNMSIYSNGEWDDSWCFPTLKDAKDAAEQEFSPLKGEDDVNNAVSDSNPESSAGTAAEPTGSSGSAQ